MRSTVIGIFCLSLLVAGVSLSNTGASVKEIALRYFTPEEIARGKSYMGGRHLLFAARSAITLGFFLLFVFTPASRTLRDLTAAWAGDRRCSFGFSFSR
jgi:hypothetical protein